MPNNSLNSYSLNRYNKAGARAGSFQRPQQQQPQAPQTPGMAGQNKTFAQLQQEGQARPAPQLGAPAVAPAPPPATAPAVRPVSAPKSASDTAPPADAGPAPSRYGRDNTPWINYGGKALDGSTYGTSIGGFDKTKDRGWGTEGDISDEHRLAAKDYAAYLKTLEGGDFLQGELYSDPRLSQALNNATSSKAFYGGVDTDQGNMSWDDWQGDPGKTIRDRMQGNIQSSLDDGTYQPQQNQQSLWQTIMGYHPSLPQDYGWQQGWDKFSGKPNNQVYGAPPEMSSTEAATGLNPGLSAVLSKGLMNNRDADQGEGDPGWPNNGPEFPNGDGGNYGGSPPEGQTPPPTDENAPPPGEPPKTDAPYTPPTSPRGAPTPTNSPWDPIFNNYATGSNPMLGQLMQMLMGYAKKPSGYDSDMLVGSYNRLNKQLGEDYDVQRQVIKEDMYRRGISDSTIHGGRLGDVATDQARAQEDLAYKLLTDAAQQESSDRQNSLGMLMNMYGLTNQDQANRMGMGLSYNDQRFNQWLQQYMMNHQVDQDEMDFWLRTMGL